VTKYLRPLGSIAILAWLAWRADWVQIGDSFTHMRPELWLASLSIYLVTQVVSALRWQVFAQPLGFRQSWLHFTRLYFIGMFFNLFLPTSVGGDVARAWYLNAGSGRKMAAAVSVFVDRLSGLLLLLVLALFGSLAYLGSLPAWVLSSVWGTAGSALLGFLGLLLLKRWLSPFDRARRLVEGIRYFGSRPWLILGTSLLSLIVQAANVIIVWLLGIAIAAPVPAGYYWILVPMITLLTILPISVNGMGVREGGMVLFLTPLGISEAAAVSLAFLWFSVFTAASVIGAGVYLVGSLPRPEGRVHDEPLRSDSDQGRARQLKAAA
jgi:uncharacterized membrane protein YbhN (UPF0104 family)